MSPLFPERLFPERLFPESTGGRLRAALSYGLVLMLTGCANSGSSPLGASMQALWPNSEDQASREAAEVPYASLSTRLGDVQGLRILGTQAGKITLWPSRQGSVLALYDGGLQATAGLESNLMGTHYDDRPPWRQASPHRFALVRHWEDAEGQIHRGEASGRMQCDAPQSVELPLGQRRLERCSLALGWADGETTQSTLWRDPESHHLWAVRETPWPGGPTLEWQVARHWW